MTGNIRADQDTSFQQMNRLLTRFVNTVSADTDDVDGVIAFLGGGASNQARMFVTLKPKGIRKLTADEVVAKLRKETAQIPGASSCFNPCRIFASADVRAALSINTPSRDRTSMKSATGR